MVCAKSVIFARKTCRIIQSLLNYASLKTFYGMARIDTNDYIGWIHQRAMRGKSFFRKDDFVGAFPESSAASLSVALSRLVDGGWIVSPWQNFYVIVPIQYKLKGVVPPSYYIDELMKFLGRRYYVSLLTAASLNGAGHQRAMSFFVYVDGAPLRKEFFILNLKK